MLPGNKIMLLSIAFCIIPSGMLAVPTGAIGAADGSSLESQDLECFIRLGEPAVSVIQQVINFDWHLVCCQQYPQR